MSIIKLTGYILVPEYRLHDITTALPNHIELTRKESGCLIFNVVQSDDNPCRFNVHEEFVDRASFDLHQERVRDSDWGKISSDVERYYQISDVD